MIYTEVKINIKNYQALIDKTIIVYRGDKNVEVQCEIFESPYRQYKIEASNTILNLSASFAQMVIQKPDNSYVIGAITPTHDGKVVFVIPPELIDETAEVGKFTFQIRLYNEDKTSRVTLPPVKGGIDVIEPIASEEARNTSNIVGDAVAGQSIVE